MTSRDAERLLADSDEDLVTVLQAPVVEAKQIVDACLAVDVPVVLGRDDHCTKGCSPKLLVLARQADADRVAHVLRSRWHEMLAAEGNARSASGATPADDAMPCPACGTSVPDAATECPDCG